MRARHRLATLAWLLLLCVAGPTCPGDEGRTLTLERPQILASPGIRDAIGHAVPVGVEPAPVAWPLPEGPLLIFGLLGEDPDAYDLLDLWGLAPLGRHLGSGYVLAAWHDGRRPIGVVFGADAAGLRRALGELGLGPRGLRGSVRLPVGRRWVSGSGTPDAAPGEGARARSWETELLACLPRRFTGGRDFLRRSASRLSRVAREAPDAPHWMAPLARHVGASVEGVAPAGLVVPRVPMRVRIDGAIDDVPWAYAGSHRAGGATLLALADGRRLILALRAPQATLPWSLRLAGEQGCESTVTVTAGAPARVEVGRGVRAVVTAVDGWIRAEVGFEPTALGGDAHPTRVMGLTVVAGTGTVYEGEIVLVP